MLEAIAAGPRDADLDNGRVAQAQLNAVREVRRIEARNHDLFPHLAGASLPSLGRELGERLGTPDVDLPLAGMGLQVPGDAAAFDERGPFQRDASVVVGGLSL